MAHGSEVRRGTAPVAFLGIVLGSKKNETRTTPERHQIDTCVKNVSKKVKNVSKLQCQKCIKLVSIFPRGVLCVSKKCQLCVEFFTPSPPWEKRESRCNRISPCARSRHTGSPNVLIADQRAKHITAHLAELQLRKDGEGLLRCEALSLGGSVFASLPAECVCVHTWDAVFVLLLGKLPSFQTIPLTRWQRHTFFEIVIYLPGPSSKGVGLHGAFVANPQVGAIVVFLLWHCSQRKKQQPL